LRRDWNKVLERSRDDTVFLTWENMATSVKYLEKEKKLRILYVTTDNRIVAIAPFKKSHYTFNGYFGYGVIEPLTFGNSDYTGLILAEKETQCLRLFLTYLFDQNDWDFIYLYDVPETSVIFDLLTKDRCALPKFEIKEGRICPYITIPDSMDNLIQGLSTKFRKNLRRSMKNLEKDYGKVELKRYDELGSLRDAMKIFFDLHQKRWVSKGKPGVFDTQNVRDMSLNSAKLFAEKDWLALYFLTVNDKPVATQYCLEYKQKMHYGLGGFDSAYSSYSVGNLITMKVIEKCIEKKIKEYDFMKGGEPYKFGWTRTYRRNLNARMVNKKFASNLFDFTIRTVKQTKADKILGKFLNF
jgi:CelD/BcsL family acetyltransferase involved in cellulose biosynthesis